MRKTTLIAMLALASLVGAGTAHAERKRVGVPKFEGPQEAAIRGRVMKALKGEGYEVVSPSKIDTAVSDKGVSLDSNDGFRAVAKELSIMAFVTGEIVGKKARLAVRSGSDGAVIGEAAITAPNPKKLAAEVGKGFWKRLGSAVERGRLPSGAKKPAAAEPEEEVAEASGGGDDDSGEKPEREARASRESRESSAEEEDRPSRRRSKSKAKTKDDGESGEAEGEVSAEAEEPETAPSTLPWVDAAVGFRGFSRNLVYSQDVGGTLRGYTLAMGPAAAANILLYPFLAAGTRGALGNLAVEADIEQAFAVTSQLKSSAMFPTGATFPTTIHEYAGGVRYRIPLGGTQIFGALTAGEHAFAFHSPNASVSRTNLDIPDTIYRFVRPGVAVRFEATPNWAFTVGGGYRYVYNGGGQIRDGAIPNANFPHLTVAGVDASLGAAYRITPYVEARLSGDIRRYFYSMHSTTADLTGATMPGIAGGAVDQYLSLTGLLAVLY
jgi:hypothetical protein